MTPPLPILAAIAALFAAPEASAAGAQHSPEAVIAADKAWGDAEVNGDVGFVERLLEPGYRSIGPGGAVTTREAIVAGVKRRGGRSEALAAQVSAWRAAHPSHPEVRLDGDIAVLTWVMDGPDKAQAISSCDIFVYRDGAWRAIYSQHSTASS